MTEELEQLLKNLKLRRLLNVYDEQLQTAEKAQTPYTEFVAGLLRAQWHERQESALEWRIHRANLPERWSLETFPWSRQPGVNRKADAYVCRTRLCGQTRKSGAGRSDRSNDILHPLATRLKTQHQHYSAFDSRLHVCELVTPILVGFSRQPRQKKRSII